MTPQRHRASQLSAIGLGKSFGNFEALRSLDLTIAAGEFLTLLGPSGSGKTTFLMALAGFLKPTTGHLEEDGVDITDRPADKRNFGMVFQGYALFPHLSVAENVAFPLKVRKVPAVEIRRRVGEMIERVGLSAHAHKKPAQLSGGQQQRVALARALVFEPGVLLLDEPFSALDKNLREGLQAEMKRVHRETGTTFVFVTHDQSEALALSDRIAIFNHGQLMQAAEPRAIYTRPSSRFVAEFLGRINLLPLEGCSASNGRATGRLGEHALSAPTAAATPAGKQALLAVRPEHLRIGTAGANDNTLAGVVADKIYNGAETSLQVSLPTGQRLQLSVPDHSAAARMAVGERTTICWPVEAGFILHDDKNI
ncbi:putative spermidine/putrescine transport system ATP-binding protein [Pseudaminobacter salicylatoxidans]|uniref:Putative spermidine/putrescine transport system ATP-binding protein n=1 Tax=Pseudaminobacter salicylatoxidans TaxID=93369 RepID=A0A316C468_PSESE|nr:ABC transporter ATP-binding protein [Pseudaminobacter salicylatoxidans]PWJ84489.1 putative spermidine/putrescine transport system ATP-binding protein [Pseudaminobacter salicylatoxidans]